MGKPVKRTNSKGQTRWMARVFDHTTGSKRSVGTFETRKEAQTAINDFYARPQPGRQETCDSFATRWTRDYPRPKTSTNKHNTERVQKFARDFKGVRMNDLNRPMARAWALENRSCVSAVRAMFNDAFRDEITVSNPFAELRLPQSKGRANIVALTEDEVVELGDTARRCFPGETGLILRAMIIFSAFTGVRQGEMFALEHADLGHDEMTVRRAYSSTSREFGSPKNGRERTIVLLQVARDAVRDMPRRPGQRYVFVNPRDGHHFTQNSLGYYWRQIRAAFSQPDLDWHELRHACATIMLERGLPHHVVAHQLGHTDGGILVARLYGHPDHGRMRQQIKAAFTNVAPLRDTQTGTRARENRGGA